MPVESLVEIDGELSNISEVGAIGQVINEAGERRPPASDDFRHVYGSDIDLTGGYQTTISCPDRAEAIVAHIDGWGANGGELAIHTLDPDGNRLTTRSADDNPSYLSESGEDILIEAAVAAPALEAEITGDGPVNATIYVR